MVAQYLRDLVIRKKLSLLLFALTIFITAVISGSLYALARAQLHASLRARLRHVAITTALLVDGDALDEIRSEEDRGNDAWNRVAPRLEAARHRNGLRQAYLMRRRPEGGAAFVVDTGVKPSPIGTPYNLAQAPAMTAGFDGPSVDEDIVLDEYGATLSGYAPVVRRDGSVAGLVGVDMDASEVLGMRRRFGLWVGGCFAGFALLSLITSFFFARALTRPILEMTSNIQAISTGDLGRRMPVRGRDEIGLLSASINRMLETLNRYLPVSLVAKILGESGTLSLGGVRAPVTVFFSDLAGFTTTSEALTSEETVALMNEYLTAMTDLIEGTGGTVDKYIGDAVMAFWGAPKPLAGHAGRACEAALLQIDALARLREEWKKQGKPSLSFRIGMNTGDVIVGNMGSRTRFNYTAMGDVVNLASRLEGACKEYGTTTLVAEPTVRAAGDGFEFRRLDRLRVKGKSASVPVYELLGRKGAVGRSLLEARDEFERGLEEYFRRAWDQAEARFRRAAELRPEDGAASVFLERLRHLRATPPPDSWDGTYEMRTK